MGSDKTFRKLTKLLANKKRGELVTEQEILNATGWKLTTLKTHLSKNKLHDFLEKQENGIFITRRTGSTITYSDIYGALHQTTRVPLSLSANQNLSGKKHSYTLIKKLGEGATAHVWSARKDGGDILVAIKIINPIQDLLDPSIFKNISTRFERESANGIELSHNCLIRIEDYGKYRGKPFSVMEHAGKSMKDLLKVYGKIKPEKVNIIIHRCVKALKYLHDMNCIHRDVKPGNILQTDRGYVLADLGIVRWSDINPSFLEAGTITTASLNLGSVSYMAPEQTNNAHTVGPEADIYALGVTWYELLSGERQSPQAFAASRAPSPCSNNKVNELIKRMTNYDPKSRPNLTEISKFIEKFTQ